jgi:hypothetical protein
MALLPDRYSLFYRPAGLERFVDGIDPVNGRAAGGVGVALSGGYIYILLCMKIYIYTHTHT